MSFFFKSAAHKQRFLVALQDTGKVYDGKIDPEYGAGLYVLTSDLAMWEKASDYVSSGGILFEDLLSEVDFSSGFTVLIQWAANLFNPRAAHIDPVELMRLDDGNFNVALTALQIRRHNWPVESFKS